MAGEFVFILVYFLELWKSKAVLPKTTQLLLLVADSRVLIPFSGLPSHVLTVGLAPL